jgi:hypothetical protein
VSKSFRSRSRIVSLGCCPTADEKRAEPVARANVGAAPRRGSSVTLGKKMTRQRTALLATLGAAIVVVAVVLFFKSATSLRPPPFLELSPVVGYLGLALLATAGVAKIKEKKVAVAAAWMLRTANAAFALIMVGVIFLLLPINNRGADILYVLLANGTLLGAACLWWWLSHRELVLASKKDEERA